MKLFSRVANTETHIIRYEKQHLALIFGLVVPWIHSSAVPPRQTNTPDWPAVRTVVVFHWLIILIWARSIQAFSHIKTVADERSDSSETEKLTSDQELEAN